MDFKSKKSDFIIKSNFEYVFKNENELLIPITNSIYCIIDKKYIILKQYKNLTRTVNEYKKVMKIDSNFRTFLFLIFKENKTSFNKKGYMLSKYYYNLKTISSLEKLLKQAGIDYYNNGNSILTDYEFDNLLDLLKLNKPNSPLVTEVGAEVVETKKRVKVDLPIEMGSLDKAKNGNEDVKKFLNKNIKSSDKVVVSTKVDGSSILLEYKNGKLNRAITRGQNTNGILITDKVLYFKDVPKTLSKELIKGTVYIRGEAVISETDFLKIKETKNIDYSNARNLVAGIIARNEIDKNILKYISFVAYTISNYDTNIDKLVALKLLEKSKFNVVPYTVLTTNKVNDINLKSILETYRKNQDFKMDGLVIDIDNAKYRNKLGLNTNSNPKYAIAYKLNDIDNAIVTKVKNVVWEVSKRGILNPVVIYNKINFDGVENTKATAFNYDFIKSNNIGKGTLIKVIRSGEVIPYILEVKKDKNIKAIIPTNCPVCNTELKLSTNKINLYCPNEKCDARLNNTTISFFRNIGVKDLSQQRIEQFIDNGYDTILKIIKLKKSDLLKLDGYKNTLAEKIYNEIQKSITDIELPLLMFATNIFSDENTSLGYKRLKQITDKYGEDIFTHKNTIKLVKEISSMKGWEERLARLYTSNIENFIKWFDLHKKYITYSLPKKVEQISTQFSGVNFVFTGIRDKELENFIVENGGTVSTSVNKNTILIVKDLNSTSSKMKKAQSLDLPIIQIDKFRKKYL